MDIEIIWRAATCQLLGGRGRGGGREDRVRRSSFYGGTGAGWERGFRAAEEEGVVSITGLSLSRPLDGQDGKLSGEILQ